MVDLRAVFADYVYFLLFLADSYYQSSGYQCYGEKRHFPETGIGEKDAEFGGSGGGDVLFHIRDGIVESDSGFFVYLYQWSAESKTFEI